MQHVFFKYNILTIPSSFTFKRFLISKLLSFQVLPIAHVSPRDRRNIRLVNPAAVDLPGYDRRLTMAIEQLHQRLNLQVWRSLSEEEREK